MSSMLLDWYSKGTMTGDGSTLSAAAIDGWQIEGDGDWPLLETGMQYSLYAALRGVL